MDARRHKRIIMHLSAEVICEDRRYAGSIENLSPEGAYIVIASSKGSQDFVPDKLLELRFHSPSGEKMNLRCRVKWSYLTPPHGYTNSIGLEILEPPVTYQEIFNS